MKLTLTNSYGQPIKPDWLKGDINLQTLCANIQGLQQLEVSRATARKLYGRVPRCGYEIKCLIQTVHERHERVLYLVNVSDAKFYFWVHETPCFCIPMAR